MKMMHACILTSFAFAGCGSAPVIDPVVPQSPYHGRAILPVKTLKIGQVYRTDVAGAKPSQLVYLMNICSKDFTDTPVLAAIAKKYANPTFVDTGGGLSETRNVNASAGISGADFSFLSLGATVSAVDKVSYEYKNVKRVDVSEEDKLTISSKLGKDCRKLIADYTAKGYESFIVAGAWNAGSLSTSVSFKPEVKVDAKVTVAKTFAPGMSIDASNEHNVTLSGSDQYFSVIPLR